MASINTNASAHQARQALDAARRDLETSRTRIATGKKIASAKDNGAVNAIATMMKADRSGWGVANDSLARGQSLIAVASAGLDGITSLLQKAREKALALRDPSLNAESKASLRADIQSLFRQVDRTAMLTEFDGKKPLADNLTASTVTQTNTTYGPVPTSPSTPAELASGIQNTSGGGSATFVRDGGATAGRIDLYLDAYGVADVLEIWQNGQRMAATGQAYAPGGAPVGAGTPVQHQNIVSFDYDPANGQSLEFRFNENVNTIGTAWNVGGVVLQTSGPPPTTTTTTTTFPIMTSVATNYEFIRSSRGEHEGVASRPMTLQALNLGSIDWNDPGPLLATIDAALGEATQAASYYGERANAFEQIALQNARLADTLETGVGNLVDANMAQESAELQAGQIRESLATKALAIANAAPQWIASLFKS